jgi:hypothetical protein
MLLLVGVLCAAPATATATLVDHIEPPPGWHPEQRPLPNGTVGATTTSSHSAAPVTPPTSPPASGQSAPPATQTADQTSCIRRHGHRVCRTYRGSVLIRSCDTHRKGHYKEKVCQTFDSRGRQVRRCVTYRHRTSCTTPRAGATAVTARRAPGPAHAASRVNGGLVPSAYGPVVRLWLKGGLGLPDQGYCSGTLVRPGVLLTAGHCLYTDGQWLADRGSCDVYAVPANNTNETTPYGSWCVTEMWTPSQWSGGEDQQYDWGLAYLPPDSSGRYPGDYAGIWDATWNAQLTPGEHMLKIGYPAEGAFLTDQWFYGNGQYFCDNIWDGEAGTWNSPSQVAYVWYVKPCEMNGGSSGGPTLAYFPAQGEWMLVGVNNLAHRGPSPEFWGQDGGSLRFDDRFRDFWNQTITQIQQAGL